MDLLLDVGLTELIFITSIEKQEEGAAASLSSHVYSILANCSYHTSDT